MFAHAGGPHELALPLYGVGTLVETPMRLCYDDKTGGWIQHAWWPGAWRPVGAIRPKNGPRHWMFAHVGGPHELALPLYGVGTLVETPMRLCYDDKTGGWIQHACQLVNWSGVWKFDVLRPKMTIPENAPSHWACHDASTPVLFYHRASLETTSSDYGCLDHCVDQIGLNWSCSFIIAS